MKNGKFILVLSLFIILGAVIVTRLFYLQILKGEFYNALAQGQQKSALELEGERGEIFFKHGEVLATNLKTTFVFASPKEIKDKEETAEGLASILELEKDFVLEKIQKSNFFEPLKQDLSPEEIESLEQADIKGVYLDKKIIRYYPQKTLGAQVLGFVGGENKGQYGLEGYYDQILKGKEVVTDSFFFERQARGSDLVLSLDYNIQFMADRILEKAKRDLNIEAGQVIVLNPVSGAVLALSNYPLFNPNNYWEYDFDVFQNGATQKIYEPGSVFKAITMACALNEQKITPQTKYVDKGMVKIGGRTISNYDNRVWGERTMTEVLEKSINTGAVFAEQQLGHKSFLKYLDKFLFFKPTKIDLQGESFSENREFRKGYEINFATAAFGQGIEITPIQLARGFSAIANGGELISPYVVDKINGQEVKREDSRKRVISQKTASQLTAMMVSVVEQGFANRARIPGYYIAGKTGTSQIPYSDRKGYSDKTWQSFVGFVPAFNPSFLILIKLDNPETRTAEYSAVPLFRELAKYIIDYLHIPPDYSE